ncbi:MULTISPECIES: PhoH family protein [unclassified Halorhodospira]|uniref:PhoH family protein n=1 Tax=unclassified Halorhodospira TaxID=2626748 RepID=UPI001EE96853|nr:MULTISPECIES: PhoH family protein [unclassified Halorhodospira]MCG5541741.1 PhoH family protein [Halorhodospira sp. M39old]MCG5546723.1 PhoH family protein [Halorhodospira sp. M38]
MNQPLAERIYVLDTSVLVHDPTALFHFEEHDVCLPSAVLEELDAAKEGLSEVARNARQVSRFLDDLLAGHTPGSLHDGVALGSGAPGEPSGRLFFETEGHGRGDSAILAAAGRLRQGRAQTPVLVSKDINLRIRAQVAGIAAEDYESDRVIDDVDLLPTGVEAIPADVWQRARAHERGYRVPVPEDTVWRVNQCLYAEDGFEGVVRGFEDRHAVLAPVADFRERNAVWGVRARNREQNFALHLLMDPEIDLVSLLGAAGTGKTLLTLAAGLAQTMDQGRYREVIATRATVAIGEEIGYLPGTEEEKMTPWMGALMDNLEVLSAPDSGLGGDWARAATADLLHSRVRIRSMSFMRGRTFLEKFVILDEAQNLTAKQMKTLITRAGPGTKVICLGNIGQIDTPYLTESTSGLTYVVDRLKDWPHSGHVTLRRGERSRLADYASDVL